MAYQRRLCKTLFHFVEGLGSTIFCHPSTSGAQQTLVRNPEDERDTLTDNLRRVKISTRKTGNPKGQKMHPIISKGCLRFPRYLPRITNIRPKSRAQKTCMGSCAVQKRMLRFISRRFRYFISREFKIFRREFL